MPADSLARRYCLLFCASLLLSLSACAGKDGPPAPELPGSSTATAPVESTSTPPLSAIITPDPEKSFRQVVGRAPFTVTFGVNISGGIPPYTVSWDVGKGENGRTDSSPATAVYPAGEYTATVHVRDSAGKTYDAERRIVSLGGSMQIPGWRYGVTAELGRRGPGLYPTADDVARAADLIAGAGIQVVRMEFTWDLLNPAPGEWNYSDFDEAVRALRARRVEVLGVLAYSSWWGSSAQSSDDWRVRLYSEPRSASEFARYAYQVVSHFKQDVHAWQVWNEPNTMQFWKPRPDAARYVALLQETALAIKYADPSAVVVFGGLEGNGIEGYDSSGLASDYLQASYAAGAKSYFDVMALQPYMLPNSGIKTVQDRLASARAVLDKNGDTNIPIWITEIGAPTNAAWWPTAPIQSETDQANWLEQVLTHLRDQAPVIFWYELKDRGTSEDAADHFGLLHIDLTAKPAYDKLRSLTGAR